MSGKRIFSVLFFVFILSYYSQAQDCSTCSSVVTYDVDLSANPDTVWITDQIGRSGQCCHGSGSEICIRFNILVHPRANLLGFTLAEPPIPPAMEYALNCGTPQSVNIPMCINGVGPHCIVYCKPGNDLLKYKITTSRIGYASPDVVVGDGCSKTIWAAGYIESTVKWNVIYPSSAYNAFLSCTSGCLQTQVSVQSGFTLPPYVDVEVTGDLQGACAAADSRDTVRVYFVNDKKVQILPDNPTICYGGTGVTLTANASGGAQPYTYQWNTGAKTKDIFVTTAGVYTVTVTDSTDCPPISDDVTVYHHLSAITVDAGDANVCTSSPQVVLNGNVQVATGGIWTGGTGTFSPGNTTLNALYTLSPIEIANNQANLTLTSTGTGGCPVVTDNLRITVSPRPIVDAGEDGMVCQTTLELQLDGQIIGDNIGGKWSTLGSGSFSNVNDLTGIYYPSEADTALGYVQLVLSSIANGVCEPVRDTVTVFFGNLPQTWFEFSQPACANEPINFSDKTLVTWGVLSQWEWNFAGAGTSTQRNPVFSFPTAGTYPVTLKTTTNEGCSSTITRNVVVSPDPVASFTYTQECFGTGVTFTNTSVDGTNWMWNFGNGFVSSVKSPTGVIYWADGTYDVRLVAVNANGCRDTVINPVIVLPKPVADFQVANICQGDNVTFTDNSTVNNAVITSWFWDFGNGTTSTDQNPVQSFSTTIPLNVKLVVSTGTCSDSIIRQVTPLQKPSFMTSPSSGCAPLLVNFFNNAQPNVYYTWDFGDGTFSSNPSPSHLFVNSSPAPVNYVVKLKASSIFGCKDSVTSTVLVYPNSTSLFSMSNTGVCSGSDVNFTNQSVNAVSFLWDFGPTYGQYLDENPTVNFVNNTAATQFIPVSLITRSQYNCVDTAIQYISVYPIPAISLSLDKTESCHPAYITFTAASGAAIYSWNYGDGTVETGSNIMNHTFLNESTIDKTFDINLTITSLNNCKNSTTASVVVHNSPTAEFSLNKVIGCTPLQVQIYNSSVDALVNNWDYGNGTTGTSASVLQDITFVNTDPVQKTYEVKLQVENQHGCTDTYTESVTVYPPIVSDFTYTPVSGCSPLIASFTNTSTGANSYRWQFGDGDFSTNKNTTHTYLNSTLSVQNLSILLIATSSFGCVDSSALKPIAVFPSPVTDFDIPFTSGCSPMILPIQDNTIGATTEQWTISDGFSSTAAITSHTFQNFSDTVQKRSITLLATNSYGCKDTSIQSVTVFPEVTALFDPQTTGCSPLPVQFQNYSLNGLDYLWNFGDGATSTFINPSHLFYNSTTTPVINNVKLRVSSIYGCLDSISKTVTVNPSSASAFTSSKSVICSGETIQFTDQSVNASSYLWNFGAEYGTSTVQNPSMTFTTSGANKFIQVQLITGSLFNCYDTIVQFVTVYPRPDSTLTLSETESCHPLNISLNAPSGAANYSWTYGDGTFDLVGANNTNHTFTNETSADVSYTIDLLITSLNNCTSTAQSAVTVHPIPFAQFSLSSNIACTPLNVNITNESLGATSYLWNYGDGTATSTTSANHAHTFVNATADQQSYEVSLAVTNAFNCTSTYSESVTVYPDIKAEFSSQPVNGCSPLVTNFTNTSTGADSYRWTFGDGGFSTNKNAVHTFLQDSTKSTVMQYFDVRLIATSVFGCVDTSTVTQITLYPKPNADFDIPFSSGCAPFQLPIVNNTTGANIHKWFLSDGFYTTGTLNNYMFDNLSDSIKNITITYVGINQYNCSDTSVQTIKVYPHVISDFTMQPAAGCSPLNVSFENTSTGANSYKWYFGDGDINSTANPSHTFTQDSTKSSVMQYFNVLLVATSAYDCVDSSIVNQVTLYPRPNADFDLMKNTGCSPFEVPIVNNSYGATSYKWEMSDGFTANYNINSHTFVNPTTVSQTDTMKLIVSNQYGCRDTSLQIIKVNPNITASFVPDTAGCSPLTVQFRNSTANALDYTWDFGDGTQATVSNPAHTFTNNNVIPQTFTVSLAASSSTGCSNTLTRIITVYPMPDASYALSSTYLQYPETTVSIENTTPGEWIFNWNFGDGTTLNNNRNPYTHTYPGIGNYNMQLVAKGVYCTDTITEMIVIYEANIKVAYDSSFAGCSPLAAKFINQSENAIWYEWNFGDGTTSNEVNPTHVYKEPGKYVVELKGRSESGAEAVSREHTVEIYPNPEADFSYAPEIVYLPNAMVSFYNQSSQADSSIWYFGDGSSSFEFEPVHQYLNPGIYDITLAAYTDKGCYDSIVKHDAIEVRLQCKMIFPNIFTPNESEISGVYDPNMPEMTNDIFHPAHINIEEYTLQIFNRWGQLIFESKDVNTGWNGWYDGKLSKQDTYVWQVEATCMGGSKIFDSGSVTLLR